MKNTKLTSVLLAVITIGTLIFDLLKTNAELFGIQANVIAIIGVVLTAIKLIYDNSKLFTENQLVSFGNEVLKNDNHKMEQTKGNVTHADFENWKQKQK